MSEFPSPEDLLARPFFFVGVGAVIPTIPLYGKSIGLSSAENGLILGAPAVAPPPPEPGAELIAKAAKLLGGAKRPLIFAGGGVVDAGSHGGAGRVDARCPRMDRSFGVGDPP